ncbi:MAG: ubiquinol-cytochrome c reductase iron-sulfur subunit [Hydrotalea sp.]|nr:ubiquinol-cytochrome c reductase iron-sulfur subunit [Hydrotalea sp.]
MKNKKIKSSSKKSKIGFLQALRQSPALLMLQSQLASSLKKSKSKIVAKQSKESANAAKVKMAAPGDAERRDFLNLLTVASAGVAGGVAVWPLISSMNPAQDVLAVSTTEIDIGQVPVGSAITVKWQGKPVFIRHRTQAEIDQATADDNKGKDPAIDAARVKKSEWLVLIGICTHLGCIPSGQTAGSNRGEFGGWFCPCHGSQYDTSGRIRKGPAPTNLAVPPYQFLTDTTIKIG